MGLVGLHEADTCCLPSAGGLAVPSGTLRVGFGVQPFILVLVT